MNHEQHAYSICKRLIRYQKTVYARSKNDCYNTLQSNGYMYRHVACLPSGSHLHTLETYKRQPFIQELVGMNHKLTSLGLPYLLYGDHVKVFLFTRWERLPVWYLGDTRRSQIKNIVLDWRIEETGILWLTLQGATDAIKEALKDAK